MSDLKALLKTRRQAFDPRDEDGRVPMRTLGLRVPEPMHHALKVRATNQGITMTEAIQEAIQDYLNKTAPQATSIKHPQVSS